MAIRHHGESVEQNTHLRSRVLGHPALNGALSDVGPSEQNCSAAPSPIKPSRLCGAEDLCLHLWESVADGVAGCTEVNTRTTQVGAAKLFSRKGAYYGLMSLSKNIDRAAIPKRVAPEVKGPIRCHKCQLKCRDSAEYLNHVCEPRATRE